MKKHYRNKFYLSFSDSQNREEDEIKDLIQTIFVDINKSGMKKGNGVFDVEIPVLRFELTNKLILLAKVKDDIGMGYHRCYFSDQNQHGKKIFNENDLQITEVISYNAQQAFNLKSIQDQWRAIDDNGVKYLDKHTEKTKQSQSLRQDLQDKELMNKPNILEDLIFDFGIRFESGEIDSIEEYWQLLEDNQQTKLRFKAGIHEDRFKKQLNHSENFMQQSQVLPDLKQQIKDYYEKKNLNMNDIEEVK